MQEQQFAVGQKVIVFPPTNATPFVEAIHECFGWKSAGDKCPCHPDCQKTMIRPGFYYGVGIFLSHEAHLRPISDPEKETTCASQAQEAVK